VAGRGRAQPWAAPHVSWWPTPVPTKTGRIGYEGICVTLARTTGANAETRLNVRTCRGQLRRRSPSGHAGAFLITVTAPSAFTGTPVLTIYLGVKKVDARGARTPAGPRAPPPGPRAGSVAGVRPRGRTPFRAARLPHRAGRRGLRRRTGRAKMLTPTDGGRNYVATRPVLAESILVDPVVAISTAADSVAAGPVNPARAADRIAARPDLSPPPPADRGAGYATARALMESPKKILRLVRAASKEAVH
jgi:hypothetical protein